MMENEARSRPDRKTIILRIGLGVGLLVVGLTVYIHFADWPISSALVAARYGDVVDLCGEDVFTLPSVPLAEKKPVDEIRRVVFVEVDDEMDALSLHDWQEQLPPAWAADGKDELDAVVCLRYTELRLESCEYTEEFEFYSVMTTVFRLRQRLEIVVIDADSGGLIRYDTITGDDPGPCPDTPTYDHDNGKVSDVVGPDIPYAEVEASIMEYIVPAD